MQVKPSPFPVANWEIKRDEDGEYELEIMILDDGISHHEKFRVNGENINANVKLNNFEYTVDPNRFFKVQRGFWAKRRDWWRRVTERFLIVFVAKQAQAYPKFDTLKISANDLFTAYYATTPKKMMHEWFSGGPINKKVLFIIGIAVIGAIAFMVLTGRIKF